MTDPPLGTCPVHPDKNAWRVCGRCGRFLCAICTHPTATGPFCADCFARVPKPSESFTWVMMIPIVALALQPVWAVMAFQSGAQPLELGLSIVMGVVGVGILFEYVRKKARAPKLMIGFYGVVTLAAAIEAAQAPDATHLVRIGFGVAWMAYFAANPRVKAVFVK